MINIYMIWIWCHQREISRNITSRKWSMMTLTAVGLLCVTHVCFSWIMKGVEALLKQTWSKSGVVWYLISRRITRCWWCYLDKDLLVHCSVTITSLVDSNARTKLERQTESVRSSCSLCSSLPFLSSGTQGRDEGREKRELSMSASGARSSFDLISCFCPWCQFSQRSRRAQKSVFVQFEQLSSSWEQL